jgi:hypothetical protein
VTSLLDANRIYPMRRLAEFFKGVLDLFKVYFLVLFIH